jgi:hypothetical protein
VFRAFFGHNGPPPGLQTGESNAIVPSQEVEDEDAGDETPPVQPPRAKRLSQQPASHRSQSVSSFAPLPEPKPPMSLECHYQPNDSLSDLVAKDAAQLYVPFVFLVSGSNLTWYSATRASQTLASLGFAPDETIADFYTMGSNLEPIPESHDPGFDPDLGTEAEQRTYYELLMGRAFPG